MSEQSNFLSLFNLRSLSHKINKSKFRWTLDKKIGGLATVLLVLLGGVSSYFHFQISEICREIEEIARSDIPIVKTTNQLIIYHNQKRLLLEKLSLISQNYTYHNDFKDQGLNLSQIASKIDHINDDISRILSNGIEQSQFAIAEEEKKEDRYRLNQGKENYQQLKSIFLKLELENQEFNLIIEQILQQAIRNQKAPSENLIQQTRLELQDFEQLTQEISQQLNSHIDGSVLAADEERVLTIKTNIIITLSALIIGILLASVLTQQITSSIKKVTQQAKFIANNIDRDNLEHKALAISTNDEILDLAVAFNQMVENFLSIQAERKQIAEQLLFEKNLAQWQASHDTLTELVNRRELEHQLSQILANEETTNHSLLYLDLDRFKIINDTCGHIAGDELLRQISKVLQAQIFSPDTLARIGGDEFAVILYQCTQKNAVEVAQKILTSVQQFCFTWKNQSFTIGVSIGVLSFNSHEDTLTSLLKAADAACYSAKNLGRNQIYVMENKKQELAHKSQEMNWLAEIHQALDLDRFVLFYQKIQPLQTDYYQSEHYEVLLRMKGENGRIIPPMAFIPIAERYQLMTQIDRWVIQTLFATQSHHYRKRGKITQQNNYSSLYTINLSGETLNDVNFVQFVKEQLEQHQIPPQFICFEITETVAIANLSQTKLMITQLQKLGCRFALDDFGSGMSSFAYLKNLPVDFLKIDGSFTRELLQDPINSFILQSFHQLAQRMGIATIAEYVDSEEKLIKLKSLGIDYAQGYWIGKPQLLPKLQLLTSNQAIS